MSRFPVKTCQVFMLKKIYLLLNLFLLVFFITACQETEPVAQAEPDPNSILVYTARSETDYMSHLAVFQQEYPNIKVQVERASTGIITERLLAEKDDPQVDVVWGLATTSLLQAAAEGMLEPYAPEGLERVNSRMRDFNDPPLFVGIDVFMSAFCVNSNKLAEEGLPMPESWLDLTNPIYQGQLAMPDPNSSGTGFMAVAAFLQLFNEEQGWAAMDALHQNIVLYTRSGSQPCKLAAKGQIPIGISLGSEAINQRKAGFPIVAVFPTEGSGWELEANALIKKNVIKPAARTFLDWAISDSAMRDYARIFPVTSVETDVPLPEGYVSNPVEQLAPNWRFIWLTANRDRILQEWISRYGNKSEAQGGDIPDAFR